jgi:hypothetical protein
MLLVNRYCSSVQMPHMCEQACILLGFSPDRQCLLTAPLLPQLLQHVNTCHLQLVMLDTLTVARALRVCGMRRPGCS